MVDFHEFTKSRDNSKETNTSNYQEISTSKKLAVANVSHVLATSSLLGVSTLFSNSVSERDKFANEVAQIAYSDNFLNEFSEKIGQPQETETEDEFVNRAKATMRQMLTNKLSKK